MVNKAPTHRLFEDEEHAKVYAKYRPSYPKELYDKIIKYCRQSDANELSIAIDVGCGSGQSTLPLSNLCRHVTGIDISREQILEARKAASNIDFRVGSAEDMSFQGDGTVDLVTTASTIHWLDKPSFMTEVSRVLRPGGVLAVYSYGFDMIHNKEAQQLVWEGFFRTTLRDDWVPDAHMHIDNGLALIELPFNDFQRLEPLLIEREVDIDSYIGFIGSWAPWQTYKKRNRETNILTDLRQRLRTLYTDGLTGPIRPIILTSPIYVLLGRK